MSPKPRKKKFSASKAVKANARAVLGMPKPTRLQPDSKKLSRREQKHKPTLGEMLSEQ